MIRAKDEAEAVNQEETRNWQYTQDRRMNFRYPIFLDLSGKRCVAIGEGVELARKVKSLAEAGADVVQVSPQAFKPDDLEGCFLVLTDQKDNSEVFRLAEQNGVLCNSVDDPEN